MNATRSDGTQAATGLQGSPVTPSPTRSRIIWYSVFWAVIFVIMIAVPSVFTPPTVQAPVELLVSVAIISTGFFALWSVLYPFVTPGKGLKRFGLGVVFLIVLIMIYGIFFAGYDIYRAISGISPTLPDPPQSSWWVYAIAALGFLTTYHSVVYVFMFLAVDVMIGYGAAAAQDAAQFKKIALYIDLPMLGGIAYTAYVATHFPNEFGPAFGAGAIALQLVVANIQLLLFEKANYFWDDGMSAAGTT